MLFKPDTTRGTSYNKFVYKLTIDFLTEVVSHPFSCVGGLFYKIL